MRCPLLKTKKARTRAQSVILAIVGITVGIFLAMPFIWMLICAFQESASDVYQYPPQLPDFSNLANFLFYLRETGFLTQLGNTLLLMTLNMVITIIASIFVAYGFSRFKAPGKKVAFTVLLSTMMLPWVVTMVPAYMLFSRLGLVGSYWPLILPCIGGNAFYIFMLRQFFLGIPKELDEAAKMDGCTSMGILFRIILPNCWPIIATMVVLNFNAVWSDYVAPSIYILSEGKYTLALGLQALKDSNFMATPWHQLMAGCVIYALPMVLVYFFCQKAFVRGVVGTGLK